MVCEVFARRFMFVRVCERFLPCMHILTYGELVLLSAEYELFSYFSVAPCNSKPHLSHPSRRVS